jgi:hypothetical protein
MATSAGGTLCGVYLRGRAYRAVINLGSKKAAAPSNTAIFINLKITLMAFLNTRLFYHEQIRGFLYSAPGRISPGSSSR